MIQTGEMLMLVLGIGVYFFTVQYKFLFKSIPFWNILFNCYKILLFSMIFTNIESLLLNDIFNFLEHLFYAIGTFLFALWIYKYTTEKIEDKG